MPRSWIYSALLALSFSLPAEASDLCSPDRTAYLRQMEITASGILTEWQNLLQNEYGAVANKTENRSQVDLSLDIVNCTQQKLQKRLLYHCISDPRHSGWTLPIISRRVYLSEEHFWPADPLYQIGVLVHEATHKCGTNDAKYFRPTETPRNVGIFGWSTIADTYSYWIIKGLCVPGVDCSHP